MDASTDIQKRNLCGLMSMHDIARTDMATAIVRFGLGRKTLQRIADMAPAAMLELVWQAGERLLFKPSGEVAALLESLLEEDSCVRPAEVFPAAAMATTGLRG
jgi:hypothetical protein